MKNTAQGFTLIELLIVIAIIGILAAVLIPNLLGARKRAYDTAAQSCAKAIATGQEQNQIDNKTYVALTAIDATTGATTPALEGTNVCKDIVLNTGATGSVSAYSATVQHADGNKSFTVTNTGITPGAKF